MGRDYQPIDEYDHQIVVAESGSCKCGATHEKGHTLWGSIVAPAEFSEHDPMKTVSDLHSVAIEYNDK